MARELRSSVRLDVGLGREASTPQPLDEARPFRIAILGDFRGSSPAPSLGQRAAAQVDRDNLDEVIAQWRPSVRLALPDGTPGVVEFGELDDFHADSLYGRLPVFARLRALRAGLADQATPVRPTGRPPTPPSPADLLASQGSLLDQIVGAAPVGRDDLQAFIQKIVAPHLVPELPPEQAALVAQVDAVSGMVLRFVLHHPEFQALESLWRSVFLMVRRVETGTDLEVHLLHVSREELEADLAAPEAADAGQVYRLLSQSSEGEAAPGWSLLVGAYTFGAQAGDSRLLARLAALARAVGAPWISAAHPRLVGCPDVSQLAPPSAWRPEPDASWASLRRSSEARWLGLVLPRFLVRLPYGEGGETCETLAFEELSDPALHEEFLWGNGAIVGAELLAESFAAAGWRLTPGSRRELDGLPLYVRHRGGEAQVTPCGETLLTETAVERLLEAGVMPLVGRRDTDGLRLIRFQAVAEPLAALAGPWDETLP